MTKQYESKMNTMLYTVHGKKCPQGVLMEVDKRLALAYVKGKGESQIVMGYTFLDEMEQMAKSRELPKLDKIA